MHLFRASLLLLFTGPAWAVDGYIVSLGAEADNADGTAGSLAVSVGVTKNTWISSAVAKSSVDLSREMNIDTLYGDVGIDHWFEPLGFRLSFAYWGDSDILDSDDTRAALYCPVGPTRAGRSDRLRRRVP